MHKQIIETRVVVLRSELNKISSNRGKLELLKNYYKGKTAIIVGTGPNYKNYVDMVKNNFNENCVLICLKQTIEDFDMICDFHIYNPDNYKKYNYNTIKPIVMFMNFPTRKIPRGTYKDADIQFFITPIKGSKHIKKFMPFCFDQSNNFFEYNDDNLGEGENMVPHGKHVIFEMAFPLAVNLGCKNIITVGWVGGFGQYGTIVNNGTNWNLPMYKHLRDEEDFYNKKCGELPAYLQNNYNMNIFSLCENKRNIDVISEKQFMQIIN